MRKPSLRLLALLSTLALTACVTPGGGSITTGNAATASTGAAGGASSVNANPSLERCDAPLGTIAVDDGRGKDWYASFGAATQVTKDHEKGPPKRARTMVWRVISQGGTSPPAGR